ncbi:MAG: hypothetical protein IPJ79_20760 [Bacteroidetes bacterium]|nr:hypothetical protein [Bacteroidota bacterium]
MEWSATPEVTTQFLVDLFNKNSNGVSTLNIPNANNTALVFNTEILVVDGGEYVFNYNLSIPPFNDNCLVDNVCFDCVYNLQIMIVDECGVILNPIGAGCPTLNTPVKVGADVLADGTVDYNINCVSNPYYNSANNYSYAAPMCSIANLPKGKYTVYKILTVDEDTRNYYLSQYINEEIEINNCLVDLSTWQDNPLATADITGCAMSCEECVDYVETTYGGRDGYVSGGHGSAEEYDLLIEECNAPCNPKDECDVALQLMLFDVSPNGQYGEYFDQSTVSVNPGVFPLSVFNTNNSLPADFSSPPHASDWRNPYIKDPITQNAVAQPDHYLEADGTESHIQVFDDGNGGYIPAVNGGAIIHGTAPDDLWIYPEDLANLQDFISIWKPSWANALVGYHPEFCFYKPCKSYDNILLGQTISSTDFDQKVQTSLNQEDFRPYTLAYDYAITTDLLDGGTLLPNFATMDPFILDQCYDNFNQSLLFKLNTEFVVENGQQLSMIEMAARIVNCGSQYGNNSTSCNVINLSWTQDEKNQYWKTLMNLYLSEKER